MNLRSLIPWPRLQLRAASTNYTDLIREALFARASAEQIGDAAREIIASLYGSAFAGAKVTAPAQIVECLPALARRLSTTGRAVALVQEGPEIWLADHYQVEGDTPRRSTWRYSLTINGPSEGHEYRPPADRVIDIENPHGVSCAGRDLVRKADGLIRDAFIRGPNVGLAVEAPPGTDQVMLDAIVANVRENFTGPEARQRGGIVAIAGGKMTGVQPLRPADAQAQELRAMMLRDAVAAAGIPPALIDSRALAASLREALRQFLWLSLHPMANAIRQGFERAGLSVEIDLTTLRAADVTGRARALGTMVKAGVEISEAMQMAGFEEEQ